MRPLNLVFVRQVNERGRMVAQDSLGKAKKAAECRPFGGVRLPIKFECVKINLARNGAAHCRKTAPPS
jgi:hypothetical protein